MVMVQAAAPPLRSSPVVASFRWPRDWDDQFVLLERQHSRLEALLQRLIAALSRPEEGCSSAELHVEQRRCASLVHRLGLHLRLEERWLGERGCLCPGHRAAHDEARRLAVSGYLTTQADRPARLRWLNDLKGWLAQHIAGADASAYARLSELNARRPSNR
jgi:hemerythrin